MKKLLVLFAGLPGAGKSTVSKRVGERAGAMIIDIDDYKRITADPNLVKTQVDPPELRWLYYKKALEHVFILFEQGVQTIIMDEVFHLNHLRTQLEALCVEQGVRVLWVEVCCPYEAIERRLHSADRKGHIMSSEESLKMNVLFQGIFEGFPAGVQNHITVNNDDNADVDKLATSILEKS